MFYKSQALQKTFIINVFRQLFSNNVQGLYFYGGLRAATQIY